MACAAGRKRLTEIVSEVNQLNSRQQRRDEMQGMDAQDWLQRMRAIGAMLLPCMGGTPHSARYVNTLLPSRKVMRDLFTYLGYGLYGAGNNHNTLQ